ncbi:actin cytoskeleton and mitosis protein [Ophidiomyces ophidiicola]|nr:actin cytoskeleton and mitosis protein [Ophidiomyces ophidiicola]KAI1983751.1 actin cytoskeleton and mitosis protein [Ophidiomyces ophidiicola]KAI1989882.1 actin cytoskeleton and mitosis protein [Ophidiomyces ophidiicola]KAI2001121.1 actin cytoskeleton and mitosis protein [Ophidiomyces ophidiicola]
MFGTATGSKRGSNTQAPRGRVARGNRASSRPDVSTRDLKKSLFDTNIRRGRGNSGATTSLRGQNTSRGRRIETSKVNGALSRGSGGSNTQERSLFGSASTVSSIDQTRDPRRNNNAAARLQKPTMHGNRDDLSRFEQLKRHRSQQRTKAIDEGLMADPNQPTSLNRAITPTGTCTEMCPEYERVERIVQKMVDKSEKYLNPDTGELEIMETKMLKRFRRSAAGYDEQLPSDIRTPNTLLQTLNYILRCVITNDHQFGVVHKFVWDRTRSIRNDFSIQQLTRQQDVEIAVKCLERIARFHILSLHSLSNPANKEQFDHHQEREQLNNTLLSLLYYYDDNRSRMDFSNEDEFRAYYILFSIHDQRPDLEARMQKWPRELRQAPKIRVAMELFAAAGNNWEYQGTLDARRPNAIAQAFYNRFFGIIHSKSVSYLMACVAEIYFNQIRQTAIRSIWKAYCRQPLSQQHKNQEWKVDDLTRVLWFDEEEQTIKFCEEQGLEFATDSQGELYLDWGSRSLDSSVFQPSSQQIFSYSLVESKRFGRTLPSIILGMNVSQALKHGMIDKSLLCQDSSPIPLSDKPDTEQESLFVSDDEEEQQTEPLDTTSHQKTVSSQPIDIQNNHTVPSPFQNSFGAMFSPSQTSTPSSPNLFSSKPALSASAPAFSSPFGSTLENMSAPSALTFPSVLHSSPTSSPFKKPFFGAPSAPMSTSFGKPSFIPTSSASGSQNIANLSAPSNLYTNPFTPTAPQKVSTPENNKTSSEPGFSSTIFSTAAPLAFPNTFTASPFTAADTGKPKPLFGTSLSTPFSLRTDALTDVKPLFGAIGSSETQNPFSRPNNASISQKPLPAAFHMSQATENTPASQPFKFTTAAAPGVPQYLENQAQTYTDHKDTVPKSTWSTQAEQMTSWGQNTDAPTRMNQFSSLFAANAKSVGEQDPTPTILEQAYLKEREKKGLEEEAAKETEAKRGFEQHQSALQEEQMKEKAKREAEERERSVQEQERELLAAQQEIDRREKAAREAAGREIAKQQAIEREVAKRKALGGEDEEEDVFLARGKPKMAKINATKSLSVDELLALELSASKAAPPKPRTEQKSMIDEDELLFTAARIAGRELSRVGLFHGLPQFQGSASRHSTPSVSSPVADPVSGNNHSNENSRAIVNGFEVALAPPTPLGLGRTLSRTEQRIRNTGAKGLAYKPIMNVLESRSKKEKQKAMTRQFSNSQ